MTNAEKFNEVFGFMPYEKQPPFDCYECPLDCTECESWWSFEFKKIDKQPTVQAVPIDVLDKIRAEIEVMDSNITEHGWRLIRKYDALQIIDKYKAESEDKE